MMVFNLKAAALRLFVFLILLIPHPADAWTESQLLELAQSRYWQLLLHYRKTVLGVNRSEADAPDFFLSPKGHKDPLAELKANLEAFHPSSSVRIGRLKQHPQCAFPERWRFVKEKLKLEY